MKNPGWRPVIYRLFAVLNFVVVAVGALFELSLAAAVRSDFVGNTSEAPYFIRSFWIMTTLNLCFLGLLLLGGIYLFGLNDRGVTICNIAMLAEITYFLLVSSLSAASFSKSVSMSVAGATGVANVGIAVQLFTGYPLIALGSLNWVGWRQGGKVTKIDSREANPKT